MNPDRLTDDARNPREGLELPEETVADLAKIARHLAFDP
jgi:hypothetical protein